MLYFAYGSNLDWSQMKDRCPSARFVCVAKLEDHKLAFTRYSSKSRKCGVADAVHEMNCAVWGIVYEIDMIDIGKLDKNEGFQPGRPRGQNSYVRKECRVFEKGEKEKPLLVNSYFVAKKESGHYPNEEYKSLIVNGAKYWPLPSEYIAQLERIETK